VLCVEGQHSAARALGHPQFPDMPTAVLRAVEQLRRVRLALEVVGRNQIGHVWQFPPVLHCHLQLGRLPRSPFAVSVRPTATDPGREWSGSLLAVNYQPGVCVGSPPNRSASPTRGLHFGVGRSWGHDESRVRRRQIGVFVSIEPLLTTRPEGGLLSRLTGQESA
jgi:hypothetical protein